MMLYSFVYHHQKVLSSDALIYDLLNESFDTTFPKVKLIFEIYIFSDDLIRIPIYKIEFQIGLSEESTPTISNLKLIE